MEPQPQMDRIDSGRAQFVIERLAPERFMPTPRDRAIVRCDPGMPVALRGRERTEREYRALLAETGLPQPRSTR